jgi:hypothetical protein
LGSGSFSSHAADLWRSLISARALLACDSAHLAAFGDRPGFFATSSHFSASACACASLSCGLGSGFSLGVDFGDGCGDFIGKLLRDFFLGTAALACDTIGGGPGFVRLYRLCVCLMDIRQVLAGARFLAQ